MDVKAAPNGVATIEDRILRITGYYGYYPGYSSQKSKTPRGGPERTAGGRWELRSTGAQGDRGQGAVPEGARWDTCSIVCSLTNTALASRTSGSKVCPMSAVLGAEPRGSHWGWALEPRSLGTVSVLEVEACRGQGKRS